MPALRDISDLRFRANGSFELLAADRVPPAFRPAGPSDGAVVLVPRAGGPVSAKVLGRGAARLVATLGSPGYLPAEAQADPVGLARLVLDGALAVEHEDRFVSGPAAHPAVFGGDRRRTAEGRLAALSVRAIRYGQELGIADVGVLSGRLYGYGTVPRSPRWERLAGPDGGTAALLGLERGGTVRRRLEGYEAFTNAGWLAWSRGDVQRTAPPCKLYVSPRPEVLADCLPVVAEVLVDEGVPSFKVGRGVLGMLRPDKLVVYLPDRETLQGLAARLAEALRGCPAHGVPFTAEASPDGLLSWGMDPPSGERPVAALPQESWRSWVTNRLASGIVYAQAAGDGTVEPWEFAVDRLALEGVDVATWLPAEHLWEAALG